MGKAKRKLQLLPALERSRECGECRACCTVLPVLELQKGLYTACPNLESNTTKPGCTCYDTRPAACREWSCLWKAGATTLYDSQRPDKLGVLFDVVRGIDWPCFIAYEVNAGSFDDERASKPVLELAKFYPVICAMKDGSRKLLGAGPLVQKTAAWIQGLPPEERP